MAVCTIFGRLNSERQRGGYQVEDRPRRWTIQIDEKQLDPRHDTSTSPVSNSSSRYFDYFLLPYSVHLSEICSQEIRRRKRAIRILIPEVTGYNTELLLTGHDP